MKCICCGKTKNVQTIEFKHGKINYCYSCSRDLEYKITGGFAIVTVSLEDFIDHFDGEEDKQNKIKEVWEENKDWLKDIMGDSIWNDISETYHECMNDAYTQVMQELEHDKIMKTKVEDLPLLLYSLEYEENKKLVETRLKKE